MLPSFLTNLFWAQSQERDGEGTGSNGWSADGALAVEHTASEEAGDWLLITTQQTPISKEETASYITKRLQLTTTLA